MCLSRLFDWDTNSFQLRGVFLGIAMMAVMHGYFGYTQPLFIQALMGIKGLYDAKLVSIYILGKPAEGDLARPFKAPSMFGGMLFCFSFSHTFRSHANTALTQSNPVHRRTPHPSLKLRNEWAKRTSKGGRDLCIPLSPNIIVMVLRGR